MSNSGAKGLGHGKSFFDALIGDQNFPPEPVPPTPEEVAEATAGLGEMIQDLTAIAVGVRARAVEGGLAPESADAMALSTYACLLQVNLRG